MSAICVKPHSDRCEHIQRSKRSLKSMKTYSNSSYTFSSINVITYFGVCSFLFLFLFHFHSISDIAFCFFLNISHA